MNKKLLLGLCILVLPLAATSQNVHAAPSSPTNVKANSPDGTATATVTWSAVAGATRYRAKAFIGLVAVKTSKILTDNSRSFTFNGLEYDIPYILKVEAGDASSWSSPGAASAVVPQAASPSAPPQPDLSVTADQELKATWSEPSSDGGSLITKYQVQLMKGAEMVGSPSVTTARNISLTTDDKTSSYSVTVSATNAAGKTSSISEPSSPVIPTFVAVARLAPATPRAPNSPSSPSSGGSGNPSSGGSGTPSSGGSNSPSSSGGGNSPAVVPTPVVDQGTRTVSPTPATPRYTKVIKAKATTSSKTLLSLSKLPAPKGSKTSLTVASSSRKFCQVKGTSVKNLKRGTCSVKVTVTTKSGKKTSRTVKLVVR
jgi:uncharacterized membrane protein YgcG